MAELTGLAAIAADAGAGEDLAAEAARAQAEQLDLLGLSSVAGRTMPGRPPGRRNVRNQRVADYLLAKYRDPLEGLVAMAGMGVDEIAAALGCTRPEAWAEKRLCAIAALPYLHQRQPLAVDMTARQVVHLTITDAAPELASDELEAGAGLVLEHDAINEAFQSVSDRRADDV